MRKIGLYVHIPFCKSKCPYCDFVSFVGKNDLADGYFEALRKELKWYSNDDFTVETIFFGGGTPNSVDPLLIKKIIDAAKNYFYVLPDAEISIEVNPECASENLFEQYLSFGINRISIGVQSLNDRLLKNLGRIHDSEQSKNAVLMAGKSGFKNINLDLIYGISGQTLADWENDLRFAAELEPGHISVYPLTISEDCTWGRSGLKKEVSEDEAAEMFEYACRYLPSIGLKQYEISNFSKAGFECKHNLIYWKSEEYIGIGAGAHSHTGGGRYENVSSISGYVKNIKENGNAIVNQVRLSKKDIQSEMVFMNLRLNKGLNLEEFKNRTGQDFKNVYKNQLFYLLENDLLETNSQNIFLTEKARPIANEVFCQFV
jgi:oxygen-independent coproporphyrinogen-3 oxidase